MKRSLWALLLAAAVGCSTKTPSTKAAPVDAGPPPPPPEVTLLITGDENGALLAQGDQGKEKGGAAETLARWIANDKHCDGAVSASGDAPTSDCGTLALSTGDHEPGPAINALFAGEPMAQVMKQMGYAASAFGKHALDFGKEKFLANAATGGFPILAANVKLSDKTSDLKLPGFKVIRRRGFSIGVIGLVNASAPQTTMAGRFDGVTVLPYEDALKSAIGQASADADALVILADVCPADLKPILDKHPDWRVSVAAAGHCGERGDAKAGETPILYAGQRFEQYLSVTLTFDPKAPRGKRLLKVDFEHKPVVAGPGAPFPNTSLAIAIDSWKKKLDGLLGQKIGYTKTGFAQDGPELSHWITTAWKDSFKADVAIASKGSIRQELGRGDITKESVYDVLPFDDSLIICKVKGADLTKELGNKQAVFAGAKKAGGKLKDAKGKAFDAKKTYTVVAPDYLYFGGDGFHLAKLDPKGIETGMTWQTPVIDWTKKQASTASAPLEKKLK